MAVALAGGASSTLHLGRKLRAWRAVLNFRGSWLSREVVFYSAFVAVSVASILLLPGSRVAWGAALVLGLACLYSIDRVYDFVRPTGSVALHSADTLLTGLFVAAVIAVNPLPAAVLGTVKALLYSIRRIRTVGEGSTARPWVGAARIGFGFVLPAVLAFADATAWYAGILVCVAVGEAVDRCEYYSELVVPTPRKQIASDLRATLTGGKRIACTRARLPS